VSLIGRPTKTGDRVWYRDAWGIPTSALVDFIDDKSQTLVGMNSRNAFIRGPLQYFFRSLRNCEDVYLCVK